MGAQLSPASPKGDHSYAGVSQDLADYGALVRDGGIIAMHDVAPGPGENVGGTPEFWNEIAGRFDGYVIKSADSRGATGSGSSPNGGRGSYFPRV